MDVDASAAAPATSNEINIQRKQRLQSMVYKRKQNLALLKKTLQGGAFWLNCVRLSEDDIRRYVAQAVPSQRTVMYLYLSLSVSQLLTAYDTQNASTAASSSSSSAHVVRAFLQLLEEYEYYFAGTAVQSVKYLMAKTSPTMFPATTHAPAAAAAAASAGAPSSSSVPQSPPPSSSSVGSVGNAGGSAHGAPPPIGPSALAGLADDASDPFFSAHAGPGSGGGADLATSGKGARGPSGPTIYKFDGAAVYEHLVTPHVPFELDHVEVCVGLCDGLSALYDRFPHEDCYTNAATYDAIMKIDGRTKRHVIGLLAKELTEYCAAQLKTETGTLR